MQPDCRPAMCAGSTASAMRPSTSGGPGSADGDLRRAQTGGAGGREPQTQEAAGEDDAGCLEAEGDAAKELLTPGSRRHAVTRAIDEKGYSPRRACRLVGLY